MARQPGIRPADAPAKKVVLMAHFDTRINTPGALDNAGGVATLLALAEALRETALPFDLEFIAFDGEEDPEQPLDLRLPRCPGPGVQLSGRVQPGPFPG